jgi:hypothetical protein
MKSTLFALAILCAAPAAALAEIKIHARVEAVDQFGDPLTTIPVGGNFELRAYVTDVRETSPLPGAFGVFSAYVNAGYDPARIALAGAVDVAPLFDSLPFSSVSPGAITAGGAWFSLQPPGPAEQLLFTAPMTAVSVGSANLAGAFHSSGFEEWQLYGEEAVVQSDEVLFFDYEFTVVPEPAAGVLTVGAAAMMGAFAWRRRKHRRD